jgi:serine/threonine protein kinase
MYLHHRILNPHVNTDINEHRPEMIGKTITHYIIQRELGRGGMEIVYKALDSRLNRTVALKLLPYYLSSSPDERKRFLREAQATSALNHPNVCTNTALDYLRKSLRSGWSETVLLNGNMEIVSLILSTDLDGLRETIKSRADLLV